MYAPGEMQTSWPSWIESLRKDCRRNPTVYRRQPITFRVSKNSLLLSTTMPSEFFTVWRAPASWFSTTYHPYRRYLRETLKMANAEDLNRLTVCALVLLGHIFLSLGNSRESMNMVTPAMQLSSKIPDTHVQLWASAILKGTILKDLYYTWQLWYVRNVSRLVSHGKRS